MNCFGFFQYIFRFFFTVLVVHPHRDHPVTTVLTHYSPMAWYSLFVLKLPLNTNQPTNQPTYSNHNSNQLQWKVLNMLQKSVTSRSTSIIIIIIIIFTVISIIIMVVVIIIIIPIILITIVIILLKVVVRLIQDRVIRVTLYTYQTKHRQQINSQKMYEICKSQANCTVTPNTFDIKVNFDNFYLYRTAFWFINICTSVSCMYLHWNPAVTASGYLCRLKTTW